MTGSIRFEFLRVRTRAHFLAVDFNRGVVRLDLNANQKSLRGRIFNDGFGDDILLGTLSLMAGTSPGIWDVSVAASPGDLGASEGLFTVTGLWDIDETITVEVVDVGPVPVPSTLLLLALGLLGAGIRPRT